MWGEQGMVPASWTMNPASHVVPVIDGMCACRLQCNVAGVEANAGLRALPEMACTTDTAWHNTLSWGKKGMWHADG